MRLRAGSDVALAVLVVGIVGMMIVPLPTFLLDVLITLNITISVVLLLTAIYVTDALRISSFPTILLVTTLFRLALNVSSTRLILLQADAGEVIQSFGEFVVGGNFVVGAVIFFVLTIIQFVVIAKGSERVAEVAARFTLDAMPGKQMAIDADLRAGHIDQAEARRRRTSLGRESQLYGSMDGAMKFVKGDAIAGIIIVFVNIIGGLVIGVVQRGMSAGDAARTYGILTIGDGLVSQIPALIISTAAGMIVTRVASEREGTHLGEDIRGQIMAQPKAIAIAGLMLIGMALIPGLPHLPFALLGAATFAIGWRKLKEPEGVVALPGEAPAKKAAAGTAEEEIPLPVPIAIELAADLADAAGVDVTTGGAFVQEVVPRIRREMYAELGVLVPGVRVRRVAGLAAGTWRVRLSELPVADGRLNPGPDAAEQVAEAVKRTLIRNASALMGIQETQTLLDALERTHPALVGEVVPKLVSLQLLADVLGRLVEERVSIRDLRAVLGAVADWARAEKDPVLLTEYVRSSLRRQITHQHAQAGRTLPVVLLDATIEETVRGAITKTQTGSYLALEPELSRDILAAIRKALAPAAAVDARPIVLTSMEVRRYVKRLVEIEHPDVRVLSFQELMPDVNIQPVGRVTVS